MGNDADFAILIMAKSSSQNLNIYENAKTHQTLLFKRWETRKIEPTEVLEKMFSNLDETNVALVGSITSQYKAFFN